MTTEEQLKAIIEAQVKGGYDHYDNNGDGFRSDLKYWCEYNILEILLDPAGLRAAYGQQRLVNRSQYRTQLPWKVAARRILGTWLTSNGNAAATIEKAHSLLPKWKPRLSCGSSLPSPYSATSPLYEKRNSVRPSKLMAFIMGDCV